MVGAALDRCISAHELATTCDMPEVSVICHGL